MTNTSVLKGWRNELLQSAPAGVGYEKRIKGKPVSPGVGFGRPCFYHNTPPEHLDKTQNRFHIKPPTLADAFAQLQKQLKSLAAKAENILDNQTADIFRAHGMICEEIQNNLFEQVKDAQAIDIMILEKHFNDYADFFNTLTDDYLRNKTNDFVELKQLLLDLLIHTDVSLSCREYDGCKVGECELKNPHILVADELTANVIIRIKKITKGIVVERCGINSHAAIIARSLGIPVINSIKNPTELIHHNDNVLIDGKNGSLIINPDESTLTQYKNTLDAPYKKPEVIDPLSNFKVLADIDLYSDIANVLEAKADGVGLYRTEFEILAKDSLLSEQEQFLNYQFVLKEMPNKPVYFRLYDLGSDKASACLNLEEENNPALGCRGARLLISNPKILRNQARALARASQKSPINVIYPMISSLPQFLKLKTMFMHFITDIDNTNIRHGIMIEVPSVCVNAKTFFDEIDFAKIGTNDLVQYLYAFDRTRDDFCYEELVNDPAIWDTLNHLAEIANKAEKPISICGEMANDPQFIPKLIDIGFNSVSAHPKNIAAIRKAAIKNLPSGQYH